MVSSSVYQLDESSLGSIDVLLLGFYEAIGNKNNNETGGFMIDIDELGDIVSGAWLQAETETEISPSTYFRRTFIGLMENELIKRGHIKCNDPLCGVDHSKAIDEKFLLHYQSK